MPAELSYDLDGFAFGGAFAETGFLVNDMDPGSAEIVNNDAGYPRQDGTRFGRDYRSGRTITFNIVVLPDYQVAGSGVDAQDRFGTLASAWLADEVRATPGAVSVLRITRGGRTRRVYGRSRRFAPSAERAQFGWFSADADFQCVDHLFYGDAELATTIGMTLPSVGGLVGPLIGPIDAESAGEGLQHLFVGGTQPGWLKMVIHGPIVDPFVEVVGQWSLKLNVTLASDDWIEIDPAPWNRLIRSKSGANMAGKLTYDSRRLTQMRIPPGTQQILLRGIDPTATAYVQCFVREAYSHY